MKHLRVRKRVIRMIFCIPCIALLLYFGIAGIFFPKYRVYIKEGWQCFIDKLRGNKCSVSFDNRMRLALSTWLTKHGMSKAGRFFYNERNFSIVLTVITIVGTVVSVYLFVLMVNFWINPPCSADICGI